MKEWKEEKNLQNAKATNHRKKDKQSVKPS